MLTQIDVVYGDEGLSDPIDTIIGEQALALPILGVTTKSSLLIRKATGLSPADIDLMIGDYSRDGGYYQGRRVGNRNVVLTIDLNPNPALGETVSGLRELLYRAFLDPLVDADHVELVLLNDDGRVLNLYGYVEKIETDLFDIETMVQISMICPDPYLRDVAETVLVNPTGTWISVPFTYGGSAETGFAAEIVISSETPVLTVKNNSQAMVFEHQFLAGDVVYLNTNRGERDAAYMRDGVVKPLLAKLTPESKWLELHSQSNTMNVHGALMSDLIAGVRTLTYRASYWGI